MVDFQKIAKELDKVVKKTAVVYARDVESLIYAILKERGIGFNEVPRSYIQEAAYNASKDIHKHMLYHPDGLEQLKVIGYLCFWVRKIKPIIGATEMGKPLKEANEIVAVHMAGELCVKYARAYPGDIPEKDPEAVKKRVTSFLRDKRRIKYLVHSMRYRTFGPHHFVMLLQNIVYGF